MTATVYLCHYNNIVFKVLVHVLKTNIETSNILISNRKITRKTYLLVTVGLWRIRRILFAWLLKYFLCTWKGEKYQDRRLGNPGYPVGGG